MKRVAVVLFAACSSTAELPSPTPPPSWGVPISGGTMLVTGDRAIVSDPDRDRIVAVDLDSGDARELALPAGSEPGRVVEDGAGRFHVALRGAGALLTLDASGVSIVAHRRACSEPRGVAWDRATDLVHVACTGGELVSFGSGDAPVRTLRLDRDLRDVVVRGTELVISRFRTAELVTVDASGAVVARTTPPVVTRDASSGLPDSEGAGTPAPVDAEASVAWRTIALGDGRLVMAHQRKVGATLRLSPGGYRPGCGEGLVESAIAVTEPDGKLRAVAPVLRGALPVDVAVDASGGRLAFVSAGSDTVQILPAAMLAAGDTEPCGRSGETGTILRDQLGAPTAVAFRANGDVVVLYPEYPALVVHASGSPATPRTIPLPGDVGYDAGRALFHRQTSAGLSCASCHPEARDDGQVWDFDQLGPRRTQSLAGGILGRAPYHWGGDMVDLPMLMTNVFGQRMSGGAPTNSELASLGPWLDRVPAPQVAAVAGADAIARGRALFMSAPLGCATCHGGPLYTNNALVDVGTGGTFKVPSLLGLAVRAPYMHDGCAPTVRDRFGACGGGEAHGKTAALTSVELAELAAFLESI